MFELTVAIIIVFALLKLAGVITLSWLAITAPIWIPLAIMALFWAINIIIGLFEK